MQGNGGQRVSVMWQSNHIAHDYIPKVNLYPADKLPDAGPTGLTVSAGYDNVTLSFYDAANNEDATVVQVSTNGGATWQDADALLAGANGMEGWFGLNAYGIFDSGTLNVPGIYPYFTNPAGQPLRLTTKLVNLQQNTSYSFRVVSVNGAGRTVGADVATVTTGAGPAGVLNGSYAVAGTSVNLTTEGTMGWAHYGPATYEADYAATAPTLSATTQNINGAGGPKIFQAPNSDTIAWAAKNANCITDPNNDAAIWVVQNDFMSSEGQSLIANVPASASTTNNSYAIYNFNIQQPGQYKMYIHRLIPAGGTDNSVFRPRLVGQVDEATFLNFDNGNATPGTGMYDWVYDGSNARSDQTETYYPLTAGEHRFYLSAREGGYTIDRIVLSRNWNLTATDLDALADSPVSGPVSNFKLVGGAWSATQVTSPLAIQYNNDIVNVSTQFNLRTALPTDGAPQVVGFPATQPVVGGAAWPAGEYPALAVDGISRSKYLNFAAGSQNGNAPVGLAVKLPGGPAVVTRIQAISANDAPERDPKTATVWGSNDWDGFSDPQSNGTWTQLNGGAAVTFNTNTNRHASLGAFAVTNTTAYASYKVIVTSVVNPGAANSMQVGEVRLFETQTNTGAQISGMGGFQFTVPAGTDIRTLKVYAGADQGATASLTASISDGSSPDFVDSTSLVSSGTLVNGVYTVNFRAKKPNQLLTVTLSNVTGAGAINLYAADVAANASQATNQPAAPQDVKVLPGWSRTAMIVWGDMSDNETGFRIQRSSDGGANWADVTGTGVGANITNFLDQNLTPGATYIWRVYARNTNTGGVESAASAPSAPVTMGATNLPAPWQVADTSTGTAQVGGDVKYDAGTGTFITRAGGSDVWGTGDQAMFIYQSMTGDGAVQLRVKDQQWANQWTKSGIDFRADLTAGSAHQDLMVTPYNGIVLNGRPNTGSNSINGPGSWNLGVGGLTTAPAWIRLERAGNWFTGWASIDGVNWTQVGQPAYCVMPSTVYVGMLQTSHGSDNKTLDITTFDNVTVTPTALPAATPQGLTWFGSDAGTALLRWNANVGDYTYNVYRGTAAGAEDMLNPVATGLTAPWYLDETVTTGTQYFYVVKATNINGSSTSAASNEVSGTVTAGDFSTAFNNTNGLLIANGYYGYFGGVAQANVAAVTGGVLRLVANANSTRGSAWEIGRKTVAGGFTATFDYTISAHTANNPADGFTFVLQNAGTGPWSIGANGGSMGYDYNNAGDTAAPNIDNSVAFRFAYYNTGNGAVGIFKNGMWTQVAAPQTTGINLRAEVARGTTGGINDDYKVTIVYDDTAKTAALTMVNTSVTPNQSWSYTFTGVDIPAIVGGSKAFVGFTAGCGGAAIQADIKDFTYTNVQDFILNDDAGVNNHTMYVKLDGATVKGWKNVDLSLPLPAPDLQMAKSIVRDVIVNGLDGNDVIVVDLSGGNPASRNLLVDAGGGTDTVLFKGVSGAQTLPAAGVAGTVGGVALTYSNNEKVGFADGTPSLAAMPAGLGLVATGTTQVTLTASMTMPSLDINGSSNVTMAAVPTSPVTPGNLLQLGSIAADGTVTPGSLSITTPAVDDTSVFVGLDLMNNGLMVQTADATTRDAVTTTIYDLVGKARNTTWTDGTGVQNLWYGDGIRSSTAAAEEYAATHGTPKSFGLTTVGVVANVKQVANPSPPPDLIDVVIMATFGGQKAGLTSVLARYGPYGDMDLNGVINADDYFQIDTGFLDAMKNPAKPTTFRWGDVNHLLPPAVNADDYTLVDTGYLAMLRGSLQPPPPMPAKASPFSTKVLTAGGKVKKLSVKKAGHKRGGHKK